MGLLEAGQWLALAWLLLSIPVSLVAGRLLARNNARYPLVRAPRPGERVASVHQLHPRRRATVGRLAAVGLTTAVVATISVGTAAALGGLPAPAQSATASVIEAISPFTVPHASPTPSAVARGRAAARAVDAARAPARTAPTPDPGRSAGRLPAPVPGIAVPTVAPHEPSDPALQPPQTSPSGSVPAATDPATPTAVDPATPEPSTVPPSPPVADPEPTATPVSPLPTEEPTPTATTDPPTAEPSPTDPAAPTSGVTSSPTPDPSPAPTDTPGPAPTP